MEDGVKLLIDILFDPTAREDEISDAAMDLGGYKDIRALNALMLFASTSQEDYLIDDAAVSIAEISIGLDYFDKEAFKRLVPFAQSIVFNMIMARKPELIDKKFQQEISEKLNLEDG